jgi:hypothetical protein
VRWLEGALQCGYRTAPRGHGASPRALDVCPFPTFVRFPAWAASSVAAPELEWAHYDSAVVSRGRTKRAIVRPYLASMPRSWLAGRPHRPLRDSGHANAAPPAAARRAHARARSAAAAVRPAPRGQWGRRSRACARPPRLQSRDQALLARLGSRVRHRLAIALEAGWCRSRHARKRNTGLPRR